MILLIQWCIQEFFKVILSGAGGVSLKSEKRRGGVPKDSPPNWRNQQEPLKIPLPRFSDPEAARGIDFSVLGRAGQVEHGES